MIKLTSLHAIEREIANVGANPEPELRRPRLLGLAEFVAQMYDSSLMSDLDYNWLMHRIAAVTR